MKLPSALSKHVSALRREWRIHSDSRQDENNGNGDSLVSRLCAIISRTWDLGFTAFGGPPVHFQILHSRFVEGKGGKEKWVNEQTYQELFAISNGLPGPASTKMLFCLALLRGGIIPAVIVLLMWCLPGAIGMYALSLGVQRMSETLPGPAYAVLSGTNAAVVGVFALAGVQLSHKSIHDQLTRILVVMGACAGLCYSALWYFPVLILIGGSATGIWDGWMSTQVRRLTLRWKRRKTSRQGPEEGLENTTQDDICLEEMGPSDTGTVRARKPNATAESTQQCSSTDVNAPPSTNDVQIQPVRSRLVNLPFAVTILVVFFGSFIAILVARDQLKAPPLALDFFASMYLAGTIIFGGGPVVMPLLRSYVVDPGWVSGRDFLIGLAIIQAFPGPNFNFAVFLGALTMQKTDLPTVIGGFLGGLGIFSPGIILVVAIQYFWTTLRKKKYVTDFLRGVNATAVGFIYTAVYRLWEIGYLTPERSSGQSLAKEPWWVVVAVVTYTECAWFRVPPAIAIVVGAVLGLCWYGVVGA